MGRAATLVNAWTHAEEVVAVLVDMAPVKTAADIGDMLERRLLIWTQHGTSSVIVSSKFVKEEET